MHSGPQDCRCLMMQFNHLGISGRMRDIRASYTLLVGQESGYIDTWLIDEFPEGVTARWWSAILDIAISDTATANVESHLDVATRLHFADNLLRLAGERGAPEE